MTTEKRTIVDVFGNALRIEQHNADGHVKLQTRRVKTADHGEHVQIEVEVGQYHKTRTDRKFFSLCLDPAAADVLVTALTKLHPPYTDEDRHAAFSAEQKRWADFYNLPATKVEYYRTKEGREAARFPA